jgi:hypothetical protein
MLAKSIQINPQLTRWQGNGSIVLASRRTRPLWFDGRFLAARDLERDQDYFLRRQAGLGKAAGFGIIHGLLVDTVTTGGQVADPETIIVRAGHGITPGGQLVMIPNDLTVRISDLEDEENLDAQFGISSVPAPLARTRTGLFIVALRPVQFTANPIASYPTSVQGSQTVQDGTVVEATAVSLVPYPVPSTNYDATTQKAAVARQIFVASAPAMLSDSLLALAMISIERGVIGWLDTHMVRREWGPDADDLRRGLADAATQQAYLLQYDAQLQQIITPLSSSNLPARFAATDYFQALPPAGRFPLASIDAVNLTQLFFPQQANVSLSIVPQDELPALINDGTSLPPIDLTLAASAYADLALLALIPVARQQFAALAQSLKMTTLAAALPQAASYRKRLGLLQYFQGSAGGVPISTTDQRNWQAAIGTQIYGYYMRRRIAPMFVSAAKAAASTTTTLAISPIAGVTGVTLAATVSPSSATGTVTFMDGATPVGTVDLTGGTATLTLSSLAVGTHALSAVYNGDANFTGSTSATLNQTVAAT